MCTLFLSHTHLLPPAHSGFAPLHFPTAHVLSCKSAINFQPIKWILSSNVSHADSVAFSGSRGLHAAVLGPLRRGDFSTAPWPAPPCSVNMTFSLSRWIPALQLEVIYQHGASSQDHVFHVQTQGCVLGGRLGVEIISGIPCVNVSDGIK